MNFFKSIIHKVLDICKRNNFDVYINLMMPN